MSEANSTVAEEIRSLVRQRRLCIFIGAGLSAGVVPTWKPFVDQVVRHVGLTLAESHEWPSDKLKKLVDFCEGIDADGLARGLRAALEESRNIMRTALVLLAKLQAPMYVTTNFDPTLREILQVTDFPTLYSYPRITPAHVADRSLCYMHGYFDFANPGASLSELVLGHQSFLRAYAKTGPASVFLRQLLSVKQVLFVGFNPIEETFANVFMTVKEDRAKSGIGVNDNGVPDFPHYAILPKPSRDLLQRRFFNSPDCDGEKTITGMNVKKAEDFKNRQPDYQQIRGARDMGLRVLTYEVGENGKHGQLDDLLRIWADDNQNTRSPRTSPTSSGTVLEGTR